jgi:hypothetical protein
LTWFRILLFILMRDPDPPSQNDAALDPDAIPQHWIFML